MKKLFFNLILCTLLLTGLVASLITAAAQAASVSSSGSSLTVSLKAPKSTALSLSSTFSNAVFPNTALSNGSYKANYFVQETEFAAKGWIQIGSTNVSVPSLNQNATSEVTYEPTWTGNETFKVELVALTNGNDTVVGSSTTVFDVLKDPSGFPESEINYQRPMTQVGKWLVRGILTLLALVWILMFSVLIFVVNRISKNGKVMLNA